MHACPRPHSHHVPSRLSSLPTPAPCTRVAEEDYNGDLLLLRYLLTLLGQDLAARLAVFRGWADVAAGDSQLASKRAALLSNSLLWRIWMDVVGRPLSLALLPLPRHAYCRRCPAVLLPPRRCS